MSWRAHANAMISETGKHQKTFWSSAGFYRSVGVVISFTHRGRPENNIRSQQHDGRDLREHAYNTTSRDRG